MTRKRTPCSAHLAALVSPPSQSRGKPWALGLVGRRDTTTIAPPPHQMRKQAGAHGHAGSRGELFLARWRRDAGLPTLEPCHPCPWPAAARPVACFLGSKPQP